MDEFEWLRDKNWPIINNTEIIEYIYNENKKYKEYFNKYENIKDIIYKELIKNMIEEDDTYPVIKDKYSYYTKYNKGNQHPIYYRVDLKNRKTEELLDINVVNKDGNHFLDFKVSENHQLYAYSIDYKGQESYTIIIKNIKEKGENYTKVHNSDGNIVWDNQDIGYFYVSLDNSLRASAIYYHELKKEQKNDVLIYEEKDEEFELEIKKTSDLKYLIINSLSKNENEIRYIYLPKNKFHTDISYDKKHDTLFKREKDKIYYIDHKEGYLGNYELLG